MPAEGGRSGHRRELQEEWLAAKPGGGHGYPHRREGFPEEDLGGDAREAGRTAQMQDKTPRRVLWGASELPGAQGQCGTPVQISWDRRPRD